MLQDVVRKRLLSFVLILFIVVWGLKRNRRPLEISVVMLANNIWEQLPELNILLNLASSKDFGSLIHFCNYSRLETIG